MWLGDHNGWEKSRSPGREDIASFIIWQEKLL